MARQKDPVYCEVCGSKAANQAFLHAHQSSHAELPRPHECSDANCHKHFVFRCQLDRHQQMHQQKSAPVEPESPALKVKGKFRCTHCNKRTRTKGKLDTHVQSCHKADAQEFRYFPAFYINCILSARGGQNSLWETLDSYKNKKIKSIYLLPKFCLTLTLKSFVFTSCF